MSTDLRFGKIFGYWTDRRLYTNYDARNIAETELKMENKTQKSLYEVSSIELIKIDERDVIATSGGNSSGGSGSWNGFIDPSGWI